MAKIDPKFLQNRVFQVLKYRVLEHENYFISPYEPSETNSRFKKIHDFFLGTDFLILQTFLNTTAKRKNRLAIKKSAGNARQKSRFSRFFTLRNES